jgi:hypothetical protein
VGYEFYEEANKGRSRERNDVRERKKVREE